MANFDGVPGCNSTESEKDSRRSTLIRDVGHCYGRPARIARKQPTKTGNHGTHRTHGSQETGRRATREHTEHTEVRKPEDGLPRNTQNTRKTENRKRSKYGTHRTHGSQKTGRGANTEHTEHTEVRKPEDEQPRNTRNTRRSGDHGRTANRRKGGVDRWKEVWCRRIAATEGRGKARGQIVGEVKRKNPR
jgi:hypothetical protein